jgi:hypothetical protein
MVLVGIYVYAIGGRKRRSERLHVEPSRRFQEFLSNSSRSRSWQGVAASPKDGDRGGVVGMVFVRAGERFSVAETHAGKPDTKFWRQYLNSVAKPGRQDQFDLFPIAECLQLDASPKHIHGLAPNVRLQHLGELHAAELADARYFTYNREGGGVGQANPYQQTDAFARLQERSGEEIEILPSAFRLPLQVAKAAVIGELDHIGVPSSAQGASWSAFRGFLGPEGGAPLPEPAMPGPQPSVKGRLGAAMGLVRDVRSRVADERDKETLKDAIETLDHVADAIKLRTQKASNLGRGQYKKDVLRDLVRLSHDIRGNEKTKPVIRKAVEQVFGAGPYADELTQEFEEECGVGSRWSMDRARVRCDAILNLIDRERSIYREDFCYWLLADASPKVIEIMNTIIAGGSLSELLVENPALEEWLLSPVGLGGGRLGLDGKIHAVLHTILLSFGCSAHAGRAGLRAVIIAWARKVRTWTTDSGVEKGLVDAPVASVDEFITDLGFWGEHEDPAAPILQFDSDSEEEEEAPPADRPTGLIPPEFFLFVNAMWYPGMQHLAHNAARHALGVLFVLWVNFKEQLASVASIFGREYYKDRVCAT